MDPLQAQMEKVRLLHQADLDAGFGAVWYPPPHFCFATRPIK